MSRWKGVDEPDIVKYDGRHIYSIEYRSTPASTANVLHVYRTDPTSASYERLAEFADRRRTDGVGRQLIYTVAATAARRSSLHPSVSAGVRRFSSPTLRACHRPPLSTLVRLIDVSDPANPANAWKLELDGTVQATRKIDNILYVVTTHWPSLPGIVMPADTERATGE